MKKIYILLCIVFAVEVLYAQNSSISVEGEVVGMTTDLDARVYFPKYDINDRLCALVKVTLINALHSPLVLEVGGLGVVAREEKENGEIWFYVPAQVKNLHFKCAGYDTHNPIPVIFKEGEVFRIKLRVSSLPFAEEIVDMEDGEHLTFKGVPITGTLEQFDKAMVKAGFKKEVIEIPALSPSDVYCGEVAGFNNCVVWWDTIGTHELVYKVIAKVYDGSLDNATEYYEILQNVLTTKYGHPIYPQDYALDKMAIYKAKKGEIKLILWHNTSRCGDSYAINIVYIDYKTIEMSRDMMTHDAIMDL